MDDTQKIVVGAHIDQTEIDEVLDKAERIRDLIKEANSLVGELASREINIELTVKS